MVSNHSFFFFLVNDALEMMNNIMGIFVRQMYNIIWKPKTTNWICGNMIVVFCDFLM
jgi:hypothetical protein